MDTENFVKYNGILHHGVDTHTPNAVAIRDGFVYLASYEGHFSLCLETWKLEKLLLFPSYFGDCFYFMAWPSSLVGSYGSFAVLQDQDQDGPSNDTQLCRSDLVECVKLSTAACSLDA